MDTGVTTSASVPSSPERPILKHRDVSSIAMASLRPVGLPRRPRFEHRATDTNDMVHRAGLSFYPPPGLTPPETPRREVDNPLERVLSSLSRVVTGPSEASPVPTPPARPARPRSKSHIFGIETRFKPLWLLGFGAAGNWLYGTGTVAIERGIWPRRPLAPDGSDDKTLPPIFEPLFGRASYSLGLGTASTAGGVLLAGVSCGLFYQDARRLARKQNSANPSYVRPNAYLVAHVTGIVLSVSYKFMYEALRDTASKDLTWAASVPGLVGQALFAVTQAQAFSGCELANGKMPLRHRLKIGFSARFLMGLWPLYGAMLSVPYLSQYAREAVRLSAVTASTLAYSLPLTTARISRSERVDAAELGPQDSWYALTVLGAYAVGRVMAGFGPDLLQSGVFSGHDAQAQQVFGGASLLAVGTGICAGAIMAYRADVAAYNKKRANWLAGMAFVALMLQEAYRGLLEYSLSNGHRQVLWAAMVPGIIGTGLRLAVLPELFCYSELLHGDLPLRGRYHWTEASRASANLCFGLWGAMSAIPGFNSYGREAVGISAGLLATLGMALPTTVSRRALPQYAWPLSPGATPTHERGDPFDDA